MSFYTDLDPDTMLKVAHNTARRAIRESNVSYAYTKPHWEDIQQQAVCLLIETAVTPIDGEWNIPRLVAYTAVRLSNYVRHLCGRDYYHKSLLDARDFDDPDAYHFTEDPSKSQDPYQRDLYIDFGTWLVPRPVEREVIIREARAMAGYQVDELQQYERYVTKALAYLSLHHQAVTTIGDSLHFQAAMVTRMVAVSSPIDLYESFGMERTTFRTTLFSVREKINHFLSLPAEEQAQADQALYFWDEVTDAILRTPQRKYVVTPHLTFVMNYGESKLYQWVCNSRMTVKGKPLRQRLPNSKEMSKATLLTAAKEFAAKITKAQQSRPAYKSKAMANRPRGQQYQPQFMNQLAAFAAD